MSYVIVDKKNLYFAGIKDEDDEQFAPESRWEEFTSKNVVFFARKDVAQEIARNFVNVKVVRG